MGRVFGRVRGLRWRLTLSYTLLTVAAVLTLGTIFLTLVSQWILTSPEFPTILATVLSDVTPEAMPYLARNPVDEAGLSAWLASGAWQQRPRVPFDLDLAGGPNAVVAVVDPAGRIVASNNARLAPPGDLLAGHLSGGGPAVLRAALAGEIDRTQLGARGPNGEAAAAARIVGPNGQTVGVLFLSPDVSSLARLVWTRAITGLLTGAVALTVLFGLLGTLFGYVWARWLTRRLRGLNDAVDAWSRGNLDVLARDTSNDELGQLARQLNRMAEDLRTLLQARQALAVVEERQRLARDLHDAVKQQVFATAMQVGAARALLERDPAAARNHLAEAERLAGQAQQELTVLIRELRPAALVDKGLAVAVEDAVRDWSRQTKIAGEVRIRGARAAPLAIEQAMYRIVQEALANVARHSGATSVGVELVWQDDALALTVADNGRGFDVERASGKGTGLSSMRERVEALGGTLSVESTAAGTRLGARVPLPATPLPGARQPTATAV